MTKKQSEAENFLRKKIGKKKNREKFFENFFFDFPKNFSVEILHLMSTLRMQFFSIIGQGVPALQGRTHTHTDLRIYYIDIYIPNEAIESVIDYELECVE